MALSRCNVYLELREILLKNRPVELLKISPKGTVPVLQLEDGKIIDESKDIMKWVIKKYKSNWSEIDYDKQKNIIEVNDTEFKYWLDRYKYSDRFPEKTKNEYKQKCIKYLIKFETTLQKQLFLMGDKVQMVDVAIIPFIRQYAFVENDEFSNRFPKLNQYLNKFIDSKLFISVMAKYKVWDNTTKGQALNFNQ